jgi:3-hydroxyacyl-CoA dehydrogenase/enoyl-CoA hydratase/3-hydroxybutyryl-CoA epimerase
MVNEACRCLDEGVAGEPGKEAAGQIDLASVMGFGFPPFRGGIIHYGETLGAKALCIRLRGLAKDYGERFAPAQGIIEASEGGHSLYRS